MRGKHKSEMVDGAYLAQNALGGGLNPRSPVWQGNAVDAELNHFLIYKVRLPKIEIGEKKSIRR